MENSLLTAVLNYGFIFIFGLVIGSFLNVVVLRMGSGRGFGKRSKCMSCGKTLKWYMLIPVFSFLFQKGKCAYCKSKLSIQYPVVEILTGVLVVLAALHTSFSLFGYTPIIAAKFVVDSIALATLVVIAGYDLRHKIIPDALSFVLAFAGLAAVILRVAEGQWPSMMPLFVSAPRWLDVAAAPLLGLPLAAIWYLSRGKAMGLGDAKLIWGVAWFLGFIGSLSALIFSFWIAAIPSLFILLSKKGSMRTEVPFGPFIALATVLVYYFGWSVLTLSFGFF